MAASPGLGRGRCRTRRVRQRFDGTVVEFVETDGGAERRVVAVALAPPSESAAAAAPPEGDSETSDAPEPPGDSGD